ncbi:MAG: hypothetical protein AAFW46_17795 [Pseudomonadota bacterium]
MMKVELALCGALAVGLLLTLSASVATPLLLLALAIAGMSYAENPPGRAVARPSARPALRAALVGMCGSSSLIAGSLLVMHAAA